MTGKGSGCWRNGEKKGKRNRRKLLDEGRRGQRGEMNKDGKDI
jgi:hypothetical protein